MIDQKKFHECLQNAGVEFITGVPDSLLNDFCLYAEVELPPESHVIAANEGNAVALCRRLPSCHRQRAIGLYAKFRNRQCNEPLAFAH